ncbi:oxaloacetate decarboxylase, mitochondrial-like [Clytia hemisphaerica]|uniref:Oxaloacetate tautomerase FAHD1, mitochondrial n=1 Tax=Clytia hemisphaerica TaxID=252671 RepID=A0A7M6DQF4_9CNID|eukprot:TCONS_00036102-protein
MISRGELVRICRKIVCVGRNYQEHCAELNNAVPTKPLLFLKPPVSIITEGSPVIVPEGSTNIHHEVELGIVIGKKGSKIPEEKAMDHVDSYLLALDMTERDLQDVAKKNSHPWLLAKCWDTFCPISDVIPKSAIKDVNNIDINLAVNGVTRQSGNTRDMIFSLPFLISHISKIMKLEYGDIILTGTPSGVGPVKGGDTIQCALEGITKMQFDVKNQSDM